MNAGFDNSIPLPAGAWRLAKSVVRLALEWMIQAVLAAFFVLKELLLKRCSFVKMRESCYEAQERKEMDHRIDANRTAVLVIDMQNAFIQSDSPLCVDQGEEIVPALCRFLKEAGRRKMTLVRVLRNHQADGRDLEKFRAEMLQSLGQIDLLHGPNQSAQAIRELEDIPFDISFDKKRFSAFWKTELDKWLRENGIDTVILTGVQTPNCIRATAYDAISADFRTIIPADCTASRTTEIQRANLSDLSACGAEIVQHAMELLKPNENFE